MSGLYKNKSDVPIIFLTALSDEDDKLLSTHGDTFRVNNLQEFILNVGPNMEAW